MSNELLKHWKELLKPIFPTNAYIKLRLMGDKAIIATDWRLKGEGEQAGKFSRLIKIMIAKELLSSYALKDSKQRNQIDQQLISYVVERFKLFDPENNTPRGGIPPQEEWVVESKIFEI